MSRKIYIQAIFLIMLSEICVWNYAYDESFPNHMPTFQWKFTISLRVQLEPFNALDSVAMLSLGDCQLGFVLSCLAISGLEHALQLIPKQKLYKTVSGLCTYMTLHFTIVKFFYNLILIYYMYIVFYIINILLYIIFLK